MNEILSKITSKTNIYESLENNKWGFTRFSEKINGRIAMISFLIVFIIELLTKQKLIDILKMTKFF